MRMQHITGTLYMMPTNRPRVAEPSNSPTLHLLADLLDQSKLSALIKRADIGSISFDNAFVTEHQILPPNIFTTRLQTFLNYQEIQAMALRGTVTITITGDEPEVYRALINNSDMRIQKLL